MFKRDLVYYRIDYCDHMSLVSRPLAHLLRVISACERHPAALVGLFYHVHDKSWILAGEVQG